MSESATLNPSHFELESYFDAAIDVLVHYQLDKKILLALFCPYKDQLTVVERQHYFFKEVMLLFSGVSDVVVPNFEYRGKSIDLEDYLLHRDEIGLTIDGISAIPAGAKRLHVRLEIDRLPIPVEFHCDDIRFLEWTIFEKEKIGKKSYYLTGSQREGRIDLEKLVNDAHRDYRTAFS